MINYTPYDNVVNAQDFMFNSLNRNCRCLQSILWSISDMSKYTDLNNIACPTQLVVPSETVVSTLAPVTPAPGQQGATGEAGKDVSTAINGS